jgi:hypothetical protein
MAFVSFERWLAKSSVDVSPLARVAYIWYNTPAHGVYITHIVYRDIIWKFKSESLLLPKILYGNTTKYTNF